MLPQAAKKMKQALAVTADACFTAATLEYQSLDQNW
jgi:hypothetical protein